MKNFVSAKRLNNSDKMDKFPERHKLPKFIQEDKLKSPIAIKTNKQKPGNFKPRWLYK